VGDDPLTTEERVGKLEVQVAKLSADMEWVKKLATTNVVISVSSLISIIVTIILLATHIH